MKSNSSLPRQHKIVVVSQVSPNVTPNYFAGEHKGWIVDNRSPIFGCFCTFPFFSGSLLGLYSRSTSFCSTTTTLPFYTFSTLLFSSLPQCVRLQWTVYTLCATLRCTDWSVLSPISSICDQSVVLAHPPIPLGIGDGWCHQHLDKFSKNKSARKHLDNLKVV